MRVAELWTVMLSPVLGGVTVDEVIDIMNKAVLDECATWFNQCLMSNIQECQDIA